MAIKEFPIPVLEAGEVLIRIKTASLNHRDLYVNNEWKSAAKWGELIAGGDGADVVIDSSGQDSMHSSVKSLRKDGRLLVFGSTTGPFSRELLESVQTVDTGMVSQRELEEALLFYHENGLHPILSETIYSFEEYKEAYEELEQAKQFGKIVLRIEEMIPSTRSLK